MRRGSLGGGGDFSVLISMIVISCAIYDATVSGAGRIGKKLAPRLFVFSVISLPVCRTNSMPTCRSADLIRL